MLCLELWRRRLSELIWGGRTLSTVPWKEEAVDSDERRMTEDDAIGVGVYEERRPAGRADCEEDAFVNLENTIFSEEVYWTEDVGGQTFGGKSTHYRSLTTPDPNTDF
ncbi:hypothetical protein E3N88_09590 [Mikania micrantha]|uniref:Uncharacterized protein n=1 Tax=Mikania micrantha TaxID=192012 RepID=A0A5N6PJJ6_9ASTR|nr:hypothetical protein E3N88_09590 [Mikania micrantha]